MRCPLLGAAPFVQASVAGRAAGWMVAPWVGAVVVLRPASTATAVPSTAWNDHSRWIREMNQEYARRLSLAKTSSADPGSGSGRSTDTGYEEDTGFEEVLDDEMHVYRNIEPGGRAGRAAGGLAYIVREAGGLALQSVCHSPTQWATHAEVDEEWKRSYPPMLRRQAAFGP